jgi:DNA-binding NarL/FixJ family response regulator
MDPTTLSYEGSAAASVPAIGRTGDPAIDTLTAREIQVLRLVADGLSTKDVARALQITFKTAASHRGRILSKLGVHETISAVRWAIRVGLVEP